MESRDKKQSIDVWLQRMAWVVAIISGMVVINHYTDFWSKLVSLIPFVSRHQKLFILIAASFYLSSNLALSGLVVYLSTYRYVNGDINAAKLVFRFAKLIIMDTFAIFIFAVAIINFVR